MFACPGVRPLAHGADRSTRGSGSVSGAGSAARCSPWSIAFPPPLRRRLSVLVRRFLGYYATVRLPMDVRAGLSAHGLLRPARRIIADGCRWDLPVPVRGVSTHARGLRLRRVRARLALAPRAVWPSATWYGVGTPDAMISQLDTRPACAPVNASLAALRLATHDSGSGWGATPFLCDSFIHDSTPVYPGAHHGLLGPARHWRRPLPRRAADGAAAGGSYGAGTKRLKTAAYVIAPRTTPGTRNSENVPSVGLSIL